MLLIQYLGVDKGRKVNEQRTISCEEGSERGRLRDHWDQIIGISSLLRIVTVILPLVEQFGAQNPLKM